jgi:2-haloacid dehalogenase
VVFDVNETLFSMRPLGQVFGEVGLDPAAVPLWFARLLRDGFALAAMGSFRPFAKLATDALYGLDPRLQQRQVTRVLDGLRQLEPHPDVEPGLRLLREAGLPAATLTNSSADVVVELLERAGLAGYLQANLSVEQVGRWKRAAGRLTAEREAAVALALREAASGHPFRAGATLTLYLAELRHGTGDPSEVAVARDGKAMGLEPGHGRGGPAPGRGRGIDWPGRGSPAVTRTRSRVRYRISGERDSGHRRQPATIRMVRLRAS